MVIGWCSSSRLGYPVDVVAEVHHALLLYKARVGWTGAADSDKGSYSARVSFFSNHVGAAFSRPREPTKTFEALTNQDALVAPSPRPHRAIFFTRRLGSFWRSIGKMDQKSIGVVSASPGYRRRMIVNTRPMLTS